MCACRTCLLGVISMCIPRKSWQELSVTVICPNLYSMCSIICVSTQASWWDTFRSSTYQTMVHWHLSKRWSGMKSHVSGTIAIWVTISTLLTLEGSISFLLDKVDTLQCLLFLCWGEVCLVQGSVDLFVYHLLEFSI